MRGNRKLDSGLDHGLDWTSDSKRHQSYEGCLQLCLKLRPSLLHHRLLDFPRGQRSRAYLSTTVAMAEFLWVLYWL